MLGVGLRSVQKWEPGDINISESAKKLLEEKLKNEQSILSIKVGLPMKCKMKRIEKS